MEIIQVRVDKIHVDGLVRTKDDIVKLQVKDLFKAKNFDDVILHTYSVRRRLESLGCFKNIDTFIDTSKGPDATPDGIEVIFSFLIKTKRQVSDSYFFDSSFIYCTKIQL